MGYKYSVGIYVDNCEQVKGYPQLIKLLVKIVINPDFGC